MDRYRSVVDFLFCEIFIEYQKDCFLFYEGKGPRFEEMINAGRIHKDQVVQFEKVLVHALNLARKFLAEERQLSWKSLRNEAFKI